MTKPKSKKKPPYQTLVKLEQFFILEHGGKTANTSCKRINEGLKRDSSLTGRATIPKNAKPYGYYWTPVEEMPYIVSGGELPDDPTGKTMHIWEGNKIVKVNLRAAHLATFMKK